ncbi:hypothetical protein ACWDSJ_16755 [Nocardia sp. NPDC003482]
MSAAPASGRRKRAAYIAAEDAVFGLKIDHWCTDAELEAMLNYAPCDAVLLRDRWNPDCSSEFYRGYLTALAGLVQSVSVGHSLDRYRAVVDHVEEIARTWPGEPDQRSGAAHALANARRYGEAGVTVPDIVAFLRGEIASVAECFRTAHEQGR